MSRAEGGQKQPRQGQVQKGRMTSVEEAVQLRHWLRHRLLEGDQVGDCWEDEQLCEGKFCGKWESVSPPTLAEDKQLLERRLVYRSPILNEKGEVEHFQQFAFWEKQTKGQEARTFFYRDGSLCCELPSSYEAEMDEAGEESEQKQAGAKPNLASRAHTQQKAPYIFRMGVESPYGRLEVEADLRQFSWQMEAVEGGFRGNLRFSYVILNEGRESSLVEHELQIEPITRG